MALVDNLKRSRPSFYHLSQFQRLQAGHVSNPPQAAPSSMPLPSVNPGTCSNSHESHVRRSITRWLLGLAGGSTLGVLCWPSDSSNSFSSFFDWSTAETDESRSAFRKLSLPDYSSKFLFPDDYRRKVFFKYEKRIRQKSPPEKVFEYFASFRAPDGELLMRPADLMRAVVPVFPPSESHLVRDGYLIGERSPGELRCPPSEFFMLFDVNNDGLVSFKEYIFFVTLLGIPEASFSVAFKMFDTDNNSEIDKDEFKKVMALMRAHNRQGAAHRDGIRTGLKVAGHVDNGGLVEYFFGEDGNGRLRYDKFVQFLKDLHNEILRLEFAHYDFKLQGTISAKDFALSMVAAADMGDISMLLDQVSRLDNEEHLSGIRISFDEFKDFAELRKRLLPLSLALFSYGEVNGLLMKEDFERAVSKVCDISLSDNVVDIIFHVFDLNCDGNLSIDEFIRVLHKREMDIAQPVKSGFMRFLPSRNF